MRTKGFKLVGSSDKLIIKEIRKTPLVKRLRKNSGDKDTRDKKLT